MDAAQRSPSRRSAMPGNDRGLDGVRSLITDPLAAEKLWSVSEELLRRAGETASNSQPGLSRASRGCNATAPMWIEDAGVRAFRCCLAHSMIVCQPSRKAPVQQSSRGLDCGSGQFARRNDAARKIDERSECD